MRVAHTISFAVVTATSSSQLSHVYPRGTRVNERSRLELGGCDAVELARRTGLSPAGVSQYLTALRDAGLVSAHRAGRSVLYARTSAAASLLAASSGRG